MGRRRTPIWDSYVLLSAFWPSLVMKNWLNINLRFMISVKTTPILIPRLLLGLYSTELQLFKDLSNIKETRYHCSSSDEDAKWFSIYLKQPQFVWAFLLE